MVLLNYNEVSSTFLQANRQYLTPDPLQFLTQVTILAQKVRNQSAFTITFKQCELCKRYQSAWSNNISNCILDNGIDKPKPREGRPPHPEPKEMFCLVRMKSKSKKLSTVVSKKDLPKFMELYGKIMKANMDGLKKVKRVKNKSKALQGWDKCIFSHFHTSNCASSLYIITN